MKEYSCEMNKMGQGFNIVDRQKKCRTLNPLDAPFAQSITYFLSLFIIYCVLTVYALTPNNVKPIALQYW